MVCSRSAISTVEMFFATPMRAQKAQAPPACNAAPEPAIVGMRGSSQPLTCFCSTSWRISLLITMYVMLRRANSACRGTCGTSVAWMTQS